MARIRSIKPEILDDEVVSALPHLAWRLFVSLITMADDYGNLHGAPAKIRGAALWATDTTDDDTREALARLSRDSLIRVYTVRGQSYIAITGWAKHQKVDHPSKPIVPGPDQADLHTCEYSRESRETLEEPRETLAPDQDQDLDQDQDQERERARTPAKPDAAAGKPASAPPRRGVAWDPDRGLGALAEHAIDRLNAARAKVDPSARPIPVLVDEHGKSLMDHLRPIPVDDRRGVLDHAIDVMTSTLAADGAPVDEYRMGMLAGSRSWSRWRDGSVAGAKNGTSRQASQVARSGPISPPRTQTPGPPKNLL